MFFAKKKFWKTIESFIPSIFLFCSIDLWFVFYRIKSFLSKKYYCICGSKQLVYNIICGSLSFVPIFSRPCCSRNLLSINKIN